jgi:hypothetical protein
VHWNEDIGEWQLKCVAYTGNNMRKTLPSHSVGQGREVSGLFFGLSTGNVCRHTGVCTCWHALCSSSCF